MKTKDPYLSELDDLGEFPEDATDAQVEAPLDAEPLGDEPLGGEPLGGKPPEESPIPVKETAQQPQGGRLQGGGSPVSVAPDVPVQVVVVIGRRSITMQELMEMKPGQVMELNRPPQEAVDLAVGGRVFAKGELVEIEGKLGVRVLKIVK